MPRAKEEGEEEEEEVVVDAPPKNSIKSSRLLRFSLFHSPDFGCEMLQERKEIEMY